VLECKSLARTDRGIELTARALRNKDTKVSIHQTVSRIRLVRFTHAYLFPLVIHARMSVPVSPPWHSRVAHPVTSPVSSWRRVVTVDNGQDRSIEWTREVVLTLTTWPFRPRLSSLPSEVPLILTRHARSFYAKHEGRSYVRILLIDAITATRTCWNPTYRVMYSIRMKH